MTKLLLANLCVALLLTLGAGAAVADVPLGTIPDWASNDWDYSTGGALADIDGDGDLDLCVGNGNDMQSETNCVYYNTGGMLEDVSSWRSDISSYHAHVSVGDMNNDGWPDFAVAGYGDPATPMRDEVFVNLGGVLETTPSWRQDNPDNSFSVAFGDVDGDGDLDLASACGEAYSGNPQPAKVYRNTGGVLATTPSWQSDNNLYGYDVAWGDVDGDGDLDLAVANECGSNYVYYNLGGALETTPSWSSDDTKGTLQVAWGDVDGDGDLDLATADNGQLCSGSKVRLYINYGGVLETTHSWFSQDGMRSYYSCVAWGDMDGDGDLDLASGGWWEPAVVFENDGGVLIEEPGWHFSPSGGQRLVCEQVVWGDINEDGLQTVIDEPHDGDGIKKVFYFGHHPVHDLISVKVNGLELALADYCVDLESGWISLAAAPPAGPGTLELSYVYSDRLDLIVTNWEDSHPNYMFLNTLPAATVAQVSGDILGAKGLKAYPNPFNPVTRLSFTVSAPGRAKLVIYNVLGERVKTLVDSFLNSGFYEATWKGLNESGEELASGIYFCRLSVDAHEEVTKLVLTK